MSVQIAVRFEQDQVDFIDRQVASGAAATRADVLRRLVAKVQRQEQAVRDLGALKARPYSELDDFHEAADANRPDLG